MKWNTICPGVWKDENGQALYVSDKPAPFQKCRYEYRGIEIVCDGCNTAQRIAALISGVYEDVDNAICTKFPNYHSQFPKSFFTRIVEDVVESSAFYDEELWNDSDVTMAIEREIARMYGIGV